jgi:hypothetical protein
MRINEILTENDFDDPEYLKQFILDNCKPFIKAVENPNRMKLYRGNNDTHDTHVTTVRQDRLPLSTNVNMHNFLVKGFIEAGFKAHRGNSLFCTGSLNQADTYGTVFCVFPIGDFHFTWSPEIRDLYPRVHIFHKYLNYDLSQPIKRDWDSQGMYDIDRDTPLETALQMIKQDKSDFISLNSAKFIRKGLAIYSPELAKFIKEYYQDNNIIEAIYSHHEIMINCEKALMVNNRTMDRLTF